MELTEQPTFDRGAAPTRVAYRNAKRYVRTTGGPVARLVQFSTEVVTLRYEGDGGTFPVTVATFESKWVEA